MMRNCLWVVVLLCLLPALAFGEPSSPALPAAPDELAGDTSEVQTPGSPSPLAPAPSAPSPSGAAPPASGLLAPESYFQLLIERQQLAIDYYREVHKALDAHPKDQKAAMKALDALETERRKRAKALFEKFKVTEEQYLEPTVGTEVQVQRSKYLDERPEVRDRISANSKELKALEDRAQDRISQLLSRPAPEPRSRPKK